MEGHVDGLEYYDVLDRVYLGDLGIRIESLQNIINHADESGKLKDNGLDKLSTYSDIFAGSITRDERNALLSSQNITLLKDYYVKGVANNTILLEIIFKDFHKEPLVLDESCEPILQWYFNKAFGVDETNNYRGWDAITYRIKDVILIGPRTYIHLDHLQTRTEIINRLKEIIDGEFLKFDYVYSDNIYNKIDMEYPGEILNKHHTYSLVKYYLSDCYDVGFGNQLNFTKKGVKKLSNSEHLYDLFSNNGKVLDLKTVKKLTGWNREVIERAFINCDYLVKIDGNRYGICD